ncbi:hypothetical protein BDW74DRAFT_176604 [Aspergillus multicolor]|uniref:uncharacterized protein n=1 Tax=Aspergillus multicolor TaxID=41759 RepID=UPI003CCCFB20
MYGSWDLVEGRLAYSNGSTTLIPYPFLALHKGEDLYSYRGMDLMDGPIVFNNRSHHHLLSDYSRFHGPPSCESVPYPTQPPVNSITSSSDGVHSDMTLSVRERLDD